MHIDCQQGSVVAMFNDKDSTVNQIALHPTMHLAMVASQDGSVALYDPRVPKAVKMHTSHASPTTAITCEPQGLMYATGCNSGDIRVWDLRTSSCLQDMTKKHRASNGQSAVTGLAFHLTRGFLASGGSDSIIKIYQPKK